MSAPEVIDAMFEIARPDDLIAICSKRPGKLKSQRGKPYPHSYFPPRVEDRHDIEEIVDVITALGHEPAFWMLFTLRPDACDVFPAWEQRPQRFRYTKEFLSQILGIFIDLDVGRPPEEATSEASKMSHEAALERVLNLVENKVIPMPTLTAPSGRGRYIVYLFQTAIDATADNIERWKMVVNELLRRVDHLAPDKSASRTPNRLFKAHGTLDGKVTYSMLHLGDGQLRRYDLDEIDAFVLNHPTQSTALLNRDVDVDVERVEYNRLVPVKRKRASTGTRHWMQKARPMIVRRNELLRLHKHRRGHWPNMRHLFLLYYATAVRMITYQFYDNDKAATDNVKAIGLRKTLRLNETLAEPLPVEEVEGIFDTMPKLPQQNRTLSEDLHVTVKEMLACGLRSLIPVEIMDRNATVAIQEKNAESIRAMYLDHFIMGGMPITCISALTGKHRSTINRYISKVEERREVVLPPRASLRGLR